MDAREFFNEAQTAADELERCKLWLESHRATAEAPKTQKFSERVSTSGNHDPMGIIDEIMDKERNMRLTMIEFDEEIVGLAYTVVQKISNEFSDKAAQAICSHYLLGEPWRRVYSDFAESREYVRLLVKAAFDWLDSFYRFGTSSNGTLWIESAHINPEAL